MGRHDHANPYCASVRMCFNFCAQLCACVFHQSEPHINHHGLLVCRVCHCVSDRLQEGCFRSSFAVCCGLLVTWLLSVSNALPWSLELDNPLIMVLSKIESGVPHWCTPGTVHERSVKELTWIWKDLLNLITRWSWFCLRLNQEFLIGVRQELCMKEVWKSWSEIGKTVEKCK